LLTALSERRITEHHQAALDIAAEYIGQQAAAQAERLRAAAAATDAEERMASVQAVAMEDALATVAAVLDILFLRQLVRHVEVPTGAAATAEFKSAYTTLLNMSVPVGAAAAEVLGEHSAELHKLKVSATDRVDGAPPTPNTKGAKSGPLYVAAMPEEDAMPRLLRLPVKIGDAWASQLVDTAATPNVASRAFLDSLPPDAVRAPSQARAQTIALGWDGAPTSPLEAGWWVRACVPWAPNDEPRWFSFHASESMQAPCIFGMQALRSLGATLRIGSTAALDAAEPLRTTATPQPQIAAMLVAPTATAPPAPLTALDVALRKVDEIVVLAGWPDLKERLRVAVRSVTWASKVVVQTGEAYPPPIKGAMLVTHIKPGMTPEFKAKIRNLNRFQLAAIAKQLPGMMHNGAWDIVEGDEAQCTSPLMAAPRYNEERVLVSYRICGDWRVANKFVLPDHELTPSIRDLKQLAMQGRLRTIYDCAAAYNQFQCDATTGMLYTVQATATIKLKPTRMHFGMMNAGSVCQRVLHKALCTDGREDDPSCNNYSDEIIQAHKYGGDATRPAANDYAYLKAATEEVCTVLFRAKEAGIVLQADKWQPLTAEANLFNMIVGPGSHRLTTQRMQAIHAWPQPSTPSKLHTFLAMASHYRHHCPNFAHDSGRLRREVLRGPTLVWTADGVATFERIRAAFRDASMLTAIDYDAPFTLKTDASIDALSASLHQRDSTGALALVDCNGRATRTYERRYGPMDMEAASVLFGLEKWPYLLIGGPHPVTVRSDNRALVDFWVNGAQINDPARADVRHWLIEKLQGFNLKWEWNSAAENTWDDAVSRADWRRDDVEHIALCEAMFSSPDDVCAATAARTLAAQARADDAGNDDDPHTLAAVHGGGDDGADGDADGSDSETVVGDDESDGSELETVDDPDPENMEAPRAPTTTPPDASPAQAAASSQDAPTVAPTPPTPTLAAADDDEAEPEPESSAVEPPATAPATGAPPTEAPLEAAPGAAAADAARREATARMAATIDSDGALAADADAERRSWAAAQAGDPALRQYFDAASGSNVGVKRITARQPTTDGLGRLFIRHGAAVGAERVRALLLVVPASHVYELVAATHAAMSHRAPASVASELRRTHWWPSMDRDVARIVDECMLCQAYTRAPRPTMPGASYPAAARFKSVHVDFVPMPPVTDEHGAQFNGFLLGVDRTTGAARSMPVHSKQGAELARAFEREWVHTLGAPDTLTADNAMETRGKAWRAMCRKHAIKPHSTTSYNKEANGLVERCVQTIKRGAIVATHNNGDRSWLSALPGIVYNYMCAVQPARGNISPHELTYGAAPPSRTGAQLSPSAPVFEPAEGARIAATVRKDLETTTAAAAAAQATVAAARTPEAAFRPGQIVWVENTDNAVGGTAFEQRQKRHGPYVVDEVDAEKPRVTLRVLATNRIVRDKLKGQGHNKYWVATRRLTPIVGDPARAGAGWLGVYDRGALPEGERADQLKQDVRMRRPPKAIGAARIRADSEHSMTRRRFDPWRN
jgi:hypothetical protein